jgi:uncharacterized protein
MSAGSELLIAILMAIGIVGTLIPFIPGLALVWFAGALWAFFDGGDGERMWLLAVMTLFTVIGFAAQFVIPAKAATSEQPAKGTLFVGGISGLVGFFVVPVIGAPIGFLIGIYLMNLLNSKNSDQAWQLTIKTTVAFGWAMIIQSICAVLVGFTWIVGLIIT